MIPGDGVITIEGDSSSIVLGPDLDWSPARRPAITVRGCPALEILDLRSAPHGLEVRVEGCPRLTRLRVPGTGIGATVTLSNPTLAPAIRIEGEIAEVRVSGPDFAWSRPATTTSRDPVESVWIGTVVPPDEDPADIVVLVGTQQQGNPARRALRFPDRTQMVALLNDRHVRSLNVRGPWLTLVRVEDAGDLREVGVSTLTGRLVVTGSPGLRRVIGDGKQVWLGAGTSRVPELRVDGVWLTLHLEQAGAVEVTAPFVGTTMVSDCAELKVLRTHSEATIETTTLPPWPGPGVHQPLDPTSLCAYIRAIGHGDEKILSWAGRLHPPGHAMLALEIFRCLLGSGADPERVWRARERLYSSAGTAGDPWTWCFQRLPGARDAMIIDLDLYSARAEPGGFFHRQRTTPTSPLQVSAMLEWRRRAVARGADPDKHGIESGLLVALGDRRARRPRSPEGDVVEHVALAVELALGGRHERRGEELFLALITWLERLGAHGVEPLGRLSSMGSLPARMGLLGIARSEANDQGVRGRALALALRLPGEQDLSPVR